MDTIRPQPGSTIRTARGGQRIALRVETSERRGPASLAKGPRRDAPARSVAMSPTRNHRAAVARAVQDTRQHRHAAARESAVVGWRASAVRAFCPRDASDAARIRAIPATEDFETLGH